MYFFATEGWVANMIDSGGFTVVGATFAAVILVGILVTVICGLNDFRNLGRGGAPWWVALVYATLFSGFGWWFFNLACALPALFCMWAFQRGRLQACLGK